MYQLDGVREVTVSARTTRGGLGGEGGELDQGSIQVAVSLICECTAHLWRKASVIKTTCDTR